MAVAAGFAPLALGSDTGGSIRQPAALCGVVGMKPTYGRVSRYGLVAFASSLDQIGPFAATVADAAAALRRDRRPRPARLHLDPRAVAADASTSSTRASTGCGSAWSPSCCQAEGIAADVAARVQAAAEALGSAGAKVDEVSVPAAIYGLSAYYLIAPAEASSNLARYDGVRYGLRVDAPTTGEMYDATRTAGFGAEVKRRIMLGTYALSAGYYDAYYGKAQKVRTLIIRDFDAAYEQLRRAAVAHVAHHRVHARRQGRSARHVPQRRVHDPVEPGRPPGHVGALRRRRRRPARRRAGAGPGARRGDDVPRRRRAGRRPHDA